MPTHYEDWVNSWKKIGDGVNYILYNGVTGAGEGLEDVIDRLVGLGGEIASSVKSGYDYLSNPDNLPEILNWAVDTGNHTFNPLQRAKDYEDFENKVYHFFTDEAVKPEDMENVMAITAPEEEPTEIQKKVGAFIGRNLTGEALENTEMKKRYDATKDNVGSVIKFIGETVHDFAQAYAEIAADYALTQAAYTGINKAQTLFQDTKTAFKDAQTIVGDMIDKNRGLKLSEGLSSGESLSFEGYNKFLNDMKNGGYVSTYFSNQKMYEDLEISFDDYLKQARDVGHIDLKDTVKIYNDAGFENLSHTDKSNMARRKVEAFCANYGLDVSKKSDDLADRVTYYTPDEWKETGRNSNVQGAYVPDMENGVILSEEIVFQTTAGEDASVHEFMHGTVGVMFDDTSMQYQGTEEACNEYLSLKLNGKTGFDSTTAYKHSTMCMDKLDRIMQEKYGVDIVPTILDAKTQGTVGPLRTLIDGCAGSGTFDELAKCFQDSNVVAPSMGFSGQSVKQDALNGMLAVINKIG